jgi:triacylglycerol lipase
MPASSPLTVTLCTPTGARTPEAAEVFAAIAVPLSSRLCYLFSDRQSPPPSAGAAAPPRALTSTAMTIASAEAQAQTSPMLPQIAAKLIAIGRVVDPPQTAALYAPLQEKEPYLGVKVGRDIAYGPAKRNLLDVFTPESAPGARPVLIFVHGGGFIRGNKRDPGSPFYDNIPLWAARNGMVGVNITYRLAPEHPWPAGAEDVAAAVRWTIANIASHGGDPARIFLMGHSAGASHVATYVAFPQFHGPRGIGIAGAIMTSGMYDLTTFKVSDGGKAYFGEDASCYAERSPRPGLLKSEIPLMLAVAELDPPQFVDQFNTTADMLAKRERGSARAVFLPQHSHMSETYAINTKDTRLSGPLLEFIRGGR